MFSDSTELLWYQKMWDQESLSIQSIMVCVHRQYFKIIYLFLPVKHLNKLLWSDLSASWVTSNDFHRLMLNCFSFSAWRLASVLTLWTSWKNYCFLEGLFNYPLQAKCNKSYITIKPSINQQTLQAWRLCSSECPAGLRQYSFSWFQCSGVQVINSFYSAAFFAY